RGALSDRDRRLEEGNLVKRRNQDLVRVGAEVPAQYLLVHGPEVDRVLQVASAVECRQTRLVAVKPTVDRVTDQQKRRSRAVVGPAAGVLFRPASELRPGRDQHLVGHVVRGEVLVKG